MRDADNQAQEISPAAGEAMLNVLAERAIALLDDWHPQPRETRSKRRAHSPKQRHPKTTGGDHGAI